MSDTLESLFLLVVLMQQTQVTSEPDRLDSRRQTEVCRTLSSPFPTCKLGSTTFGPTPKNKVQSTKNKSPVCSAHQNLLHRHYCRSMDGDKSRRLCYRFGLRDAKWTG